MNRMRASRDRGPRPSLNGRRTLRKDCPRRASGWAPQISKFRTIGRSFGRGRPRTTRHQEINQRLDPIGVGKPGNVSAGFRAVQAAAPLQNATFGALNVSNARASLASSTYPPRLLRNAKAADTRAGPGRVHASFAAEAPRFTSSRSTQLRNCRGRLPRIHGRRRVALAPQ